MKFFHAVVTPTMLFGLHILALTAVQLSKLEPIQRRMLRSMVGWIRIQDETWHDTMSRMKTRVATALRQHPIETWTTRLAKCQHSFACRVAQTNVVGWHAWSFGIPSRNGMATSLRHPSADKDAHWLDGIISCEFCARPSFLKHNVGCTVAESSAWKRKANDFVNEFFQAVQRRI